MQYFWGAKSLKIIAKKQLHLFDPGISLYSMILETGIFMLKLHFGLPMTLAFHTSSNSTFVTDPVPCGYVLIAKQLGLWGVYHVQCIHPRNLTYYRHQQWPFWKRYNSSKPSFLLSIRYISGVYHSFCFWFFFRKIQGWKLGKPHLPFTCKGLSWSTFLYDSPD